MYDLTAVYDFAGLDDILDDIKQLPDVFEDAMIEVGVEVETRYVPSLALYPATRAVHPFQFATPKSKRKYFALIREGKVRTDSYGYVRNGGYGKSWSVEIEQDGTGVTLSVRTSFPAAIYVGGKRQVPGHRNTGWIQYEPILDEIHSFADLRFYQIVEPYV